VIRSSIEVQEIMQELDAPVEPPDKEVARIIRTALAEDVGDGDVTTITTIPESAVFEGELVVKEDGIVAGLEVARRVFDQIDPRVEWANLPRSGEVARGLVQDGDWVRAGQTIARLYGHGRALLTGERVALNLLQRMSGIATLTRRYVDAVRDTRARILDTRKTAPGLRVLDKWAVRLGGGQNHRSGLYDMALIKDNQSAAVGSIAEAVRRVRSGDGRGRLIEVEVTNLDQLREALEQPVDRIMLDNMTLGEMREAVHISAGRIPLEASGKVNLDTVHAIAATGVDFISCGALTHSVKALDISLELRASGPARGKPAPASPHGPGYEGNGSKI
jgi:nicotinate-nucleotide pyrophosphorylase (carboxylating)